ncbi:hypothetical protein [Christiangramia salexigens]|uniref:Uncharacterized protein n=1 Tax=Christiangramia salexigens TaxID=1913577 RepID=A0A1L3J6W1_9FLAO|nr:hypothetical protein [Christiangramia salexigens]APG60833.1 hypothetical protein LPB144_10635 [Christiangramia salexigens]
MKRLFPFIAIIITLGLFTSCGSNKELQERAPAQFGEVYYTQKSDGLSLTIPVNVIQDQRISLDAVYFKGMKSLLVQDEERKNLYVANFNTGSDDMVMSSDPMEEYGNKAPQKPEKSPVEVGDDEAILVFTQNNTTKYYKLKGIIEKE